MCELRCWERPDVGAVSGPRLRALDGGPGPRAEGLGRARWPEMETGPPNLGPVTNSTRRRASARFYRHSAGGDCAATTTRPFAASIHATLASRAAWLAGGVAPRHALHQGRIGPRAGRHPAVPRDPQPQPDVAVPRRSIDDAQARRLAG